MSVKLMTRRKAHDQQNNLATQQQAAALSNAGEVDAAVDLMFAKHAVDHDPAPGQGPGREGLCECFQTLTAAFPDAHLEPATLVADDLCLAYTSTGTPPGRVSGRRDQGKRIEVRGLQVGPFAGGQLIER